MQHGYGSPEDAARVEVPSREAHHVATDFSPAAGWAVVLLEVDDGDDPRIDGSLCHLEEGGWICRSSGSVGGSMWKSTEDGGVLYFAEKAVPEATAAVIRYRGEEHRVPVRNGYILFADWDAPADFDDLPSVSRFVLH